MNKAYLPLQQNSNTHFANGSGVKSRETAEKFVKSAGFIFLVF
jgi:hypothetical protein